MTKLDQLKTTEALGDTEVDALIAFARLMRADALYDTASPELLASIGRGFAELDRGEAISLDELDARLG